MKLNPQLIGRFLLCVASATTYQIATNPFVQSALLLIPYPFQWVNYRPWWLFWNGHAVVAFWIVAAWLALCAVAVATGVHRKSRLAGLEHVDIFTARPFLNLLGDEQQGWTPQFLVDKWKPGTPPWLIAFSCCAWRNKLRNLPFSQSLSWLHKPKGYLVTAERRMGAVLFRLRWRGWMTEFEYVTAKRFGDFGPRLDQPDSWGAISWAYRPWGRL